MRSINILRTGILALAALFFAALSGCATVCGDDLINCRGKCKRAKVDCKKEGDKEYCKKEYFDACRALGVLHNHGLNVPRDNKKAVEYYTLACEEKDPLACTHLAFMFENGHGVEVSQATALRYYRLGCRSHVNTACLGKERLEDAGDAVPTPEPEQKPAPAKVEPAAAEPAAAEPAAAEPAAAEPAATEPAKSE